MKEISQLLDSLDLEKQARKRAGNPITEIETRQSQLIDSLHTIRKAIQSQTLIPEPLPHKPSNLPFPPRNIFDWIIIFVGVAAIISGLMLITGILRNFKRKQRITDKKPAPPVTYTPRSVRQSSLQKDIPSSEPQNDSVADLKQRIVENQEQSLYSRPGIADKLIEPAEETRKMSEMEFKVLQAARDGVSVQEISRRYLISTDHVSLILRISGHKLR
ncbi:MAG: hypothetical protein GX556_06205 [Fibrobacter sp.]|nr:hypothetical protein [Fibrobacter sp.]